MASSVSPVTALGVWKQRNFAWYMGGAAVSLFGMWAQRVALFWLAWQLTHSEFWLGLIAFADLFPTVVITPFAGALADRTNRLNMSRISQGAAGVQAFVLAWMTLTGRLTEPGDIWWLLGLGLFLGIAMAFGTAARLSLVPNLMERKFIPAALANDAAIYNSARVVGPMIAAAVIAEWNAGIAFLANGFCFTFFVICLMFTRLIHHERDDRKGGNMLTQTMDGVRYASVHPGIGPILVVLTAIAVGVKPFLEFLPAISDRIFDAGVDGFAQLAAAGGVGAVATAIWFALRGPVRGLTYITIGALGLGAGGVVLLCATSNLWLGLAGAFIAGAAVTISGTGAQTLMQNAVDGAMRGRVMALYGMLHRGAPALGALGIGAVAEFIGIRTALSATALALCLSALAWAFSRRTTMAIALEKPRED